MKLITIDVIWPEAVPNPLGQESRLNNLPKENFQVAGEEILELTFKKIQLGNGTMVEHVEVQPKELWWWNFVKLVELCEGSGLVKLG